MSNRFHARVLYNTLIQAGLLTSLLCVTWVLLSQVQFLYPSLYSLMEIDDHIQIYAPQNRYKQHFEETDREQHLLLFGQILQAVNHAALNKKHALKLSDIGYQDKQGKPHQLLRAKEIGHLEDVAKLLRGLFLAGLCSSVLIPALLLKKRKPNLYGFGEIISLWAFILGAISLFIFLMGPKQVFYYLHTLVFPPDHPWFFYYQDSLMTTLMKAPDLFAPMAILWITTTFLGSVAVYTLLLRATGSTLQPKDATA